MINGWLGGTLNKTEGVWTWNNGQLMVWENWYHTSPDFTGSSDYEYVHLRSDKKFYNGIRPHYSSTIYCEKEYGNVSRYIR